MQFKIYSTIESIIEELGKDGYFIVQKAEIEHHKASLEYLKNRDYTYLIDSIQKNFDNKPKEAYVKYFSVRTYFLHLPLSRTFIGGVVKTQVTEEVLKEYLIGIDKSISFLEKFYSYELRKAGFKI